MKPRKLFMNAKPLEQPEHSYPYGKNGIQGDQLDSVFNEPGFAAMSAAIPYGFNGAIETDHKIILFSTNGTDSAIGYFNPDSDTYEPIVDDNPAALVNWPSNGDRLGFSSARYITGVAQRNYKGEVVVAFTNKVDFPKYLNCDDPQITKLDDLRLFPISIAPTLSLSESTGGSLAPGTYFIVTSYEKSDGTVTPWAEPSSGITIGAGVVSDISDKGIQVSVSNADSAYEFLRIAVISKVKGVTRGVMLLDPLPISGGNGELFFTGDNLTEEISVQELLTPPAVYSKVGTIGQLNDSIYLGRLSREPDLLDLQPYANLVQLSWVSELIDATSPPDEHIKGRKKSLPHEEVIAFYIRYHKTTGGFTKAFHIPGLEVPSAQEAASTEATTGGGTAPIFKVEDTIPSFTLGTLSGQFGYWRNDNELYPDDPAFDSSSLPGGENLRNQKVRHHKTPSMRWCKNNLYSTEADYGRTKLDILGVKASNITIPAAYTGLIDGYQILYAKRTAANMTNLGQSTLLHGAVATSEVALPTGTANIYTTGGNWGSGILHSGKGDYNDDWELTEIRQDTFRFHAFDLLLNRPSITPSFISAQWKLVKQNLRTEGYLEDGADNGEHNMPTVHLVDYTQGDDPGAISAGSHLRAITSSQYLGAGTISNKFNNSRHEACYAGVLAGSNWPLTTESMLYRIRGQSYTEDSATATQEQAYVVNLIAVKEDVYSNFYSQTLVSAGEYKALADLTPFWGGDSFVCDYTFHTYGRHDSVDTQGEAHKGKKVIRRFVCESASNIHLRYEVPGNEYSKFYPKNGVAVDAPASCYITMFDRSKDPNQFGYTKDLGALNEFVSTSIFNVFLEELTEFPYRIHRGGRISRQNKQRSWRSFLPLDYYECQKNMGEIVHLEGMDDTLLIHHQYALFRTRDKAKLEAGLLSVTLGAGDIFQFEPQEAQSSKLGYAGTLHDLACIKTPVGYIFPDAGLGEFFLLKGSLANLGKDINNFLREYMRLTGTNVFTGNGITVGWDQKYKRILLTVKNLGDDEIDRSFTLSYNYRDEAWAFFHDYVPDMYLHTRGQLYSIRDGTIYRHHAGAPGVYYSSEVSQRKPFFVDMIFRSKEELILEVVNWVSEFFTDATQPFLTLTHISVWNSHQHSGRVPLSKLYDNKTFQTRNTKGTWNFNDFRNVLLEKGEPFLNSIFQDYSLDPAAASSEIPWYDRELLQDNWFCVRFELDNLINGTLVLHDTILQATKSAR